MEKTFISGTNKERVIFFRCSTRAQDFDSQNEIISAYFKKHNIDASEYCIAQEYISGDEDYNKRILKEIISKSAAGTMIYISELSRLSRNMSDLFMIVSTCSDKDITIIQCKDGTPIENNSTGGKALLFALGLAAELELQNIRLRTQAGMDNIKNNIDKHGYHTSKAGNIITRIGNEKGCDMTNAQAVASRIKTDRSNEWWNTNTGVDWVKKELLDGTPKDKIISGFNYLHSKDPDNYSTPKGNEMDLYSFYRYKSKLGL